MNNIYENNQKKLWELNDQSFNNKKMLIKKRIKKINGIKYKYNNILINVLKNSKSNLINFSFNKINNSTQNEKNPINLNNIISYTNSPSKIIDSINENNNINNNINNNNNINILYNKTQSNYKKIYVPKFSLKTSNSFFNKKNTFKFKNKLNENNCKSVDNIKRKKCFCLLTERNNSNKNFYQKLKLKYYSGNKILNKNEKILNKIYNSSPELKNKINLIKKQKNIYSLREYQKKLYNNIKTNLSFKINRKLQNDFYNIRKTTFVPKLEDSFQFLNNIEKKEKQILDNFNNIEENFNLKIKFIDSKYDKLKPFKLNLKKIKFKKIINV